MHLPYNEAATSELTISYLLVSQNGTPATAFDGGTSINISWESSGTYFNLYAGNGNQPLYSGTDSNFLISQGFLVDTTIILEATFNGEKLYKSVTVTINNPSLKPASITVAVNNTVKKDLTTTGNATFNQLAVDGQFLYSDSNDPSFMINGPLRCNYPVNVTGKTSIQGLSADDTTSKEVVIGDKLTISSGQVSLFNESNIIYQGQDVLTNKQFTAHTDGYFIAYLPTYDIQSLVGYFSTITIQLNSYVFKATGGMAWFSAANSGVVCLPISKGTSLTYSTTYQFSFVKSPKAITVQWYPIGINTSTKETYELIDLPASSKEEPSIDMTAQETSQKTARLAAASSFIQTIERACNKTIDTQTKQLLVEKLLAFR